MQLEKENIFTLVKNKEHNIAGEFLESDLLSDLEECDYLLDEVNKKESSLIETVCHINTLFLGLGYSSFIASLNPGTVRYLAFLGMFFLLMHLLSKDNFIRKLSAKRSIQNVWGFLIRPKIFNKDIAFNRLEGKTVSLLDQIGDTKNKAMIARLYQYFDRKDSNKKHRSTFARIMTCYKKEDNNQILKELMEVYSNVKQIMKVENDDFLADDISKELIDNEQLEEIKAKNIFKKRQNYQV